MTEPQPLFPATGPVPCAEHPDTETRLRCSRCGKPICPRCAVRTPVGMRCPDCAGTRAISKANPTRTLVAAGGGLVVATLAGLGWGFFPDWQFYWALLLGFGVVETMVRLLNVQRGQNPRGVDLQAIAIVIVLYGMVLSRAVIMQRLGVDLEMLGELRPVVQRALYLRPIPDLLFALLPILIAWVRFR
ncbi:MAG: hypothetical protein IT338_14740 [Thermomicrobiales bacterium]|nr:hypothetical protein [Thermomicrobiales bacterium]